MNHRLVSFRIPPDELVFDDERGSVRLIRHHEVEHTVLPVIAAIDRSERAGSVIRQAKRLADDSDVNLHIVHVGEPELPHPSGGYDPDQADFISERKAAGIARDSGQAVLEGNEFEPVGLQGDPGEELLEYASEQNADYIVVSARKRTPLGQAVFGSVTQSILLNANCPVVATPNEFK